MAFGITREELNDWKQKVRCGKIAFLTHFWWDKRFPEYYSVTKVGCSDVHKLISWGKTYNLQADWIHLDEKYPHFDIFGNKQLEILQHEQLFDQIERFQLHRAKNTDQL